MLLVNKKISIFLFLIIFSFLFPNIYSSENIVYVLPIRVKIDGFNELLLISIKYNNKIFRFDVSNGDIIEINFTHGSYVYHQYFEITVNKKAYISVYPRETIRKIMMDRGYYRVSFVSRVIGCNSYQGFLNNKSSFTVLLPMIKINEKITSSGKIIYLDAVNIMLKPARIISVKPFSLKLDSPYKLTVIDRNWIQFSDRNDYLILPYDEAFKISYLLSSSYVSFSRRIDDIHLVISIEAEKIDNLDIGREILYKLTNTLLSELDQYMSILKNIGIGSSIFDKKYSYANILFKQALESYQNGNLDGVRYFLSRGLDQYTFIRQDIRRMFLGSYIYFPIILVSLIVFSTFVSRLFFEKYFKFGFLATLLIILIILLIVSTETHIFLFFGLVSFFEDNLRTLLPYELQRSSLTSITLVIVFLVSLVISGLFAYFIVSSEKIHFSLLLLKRRKIHFFLVLITIMVVASGLSIHGSSMYGIITEKLIIDEHSKAPNFLYLYKRSLYRIKISTRTSYKVFEKSHLQYFNQYDIQLLKMLLNESNTSIIIHAFTFLKINDRNVFLLFTDPRYLANFGIGSFCNETVIISKDLAQLMKIYEGEYINVGKHRLKILKILDSPITDYDLRIITSDVVSNKSSNYFAILPSKYVKEFNNVYVDKILFFNVSEHILSKIMEIRLGLSYISKVTLSKEKTLIMGYDYPIIKGENKVIILERFDDLGIIFISDWYSQLIVLTIGFLIISSNALASVYERRRDLKILTCTGASPLDLFINIISEGIGIGIIGGLGGFVLGRIMNMMYTSLVGNKSLYPSIELSYLAYSLVIALLSSIIGYLIPARKGILEVVPSKLLKRSSGKIAKVSKNELLLDNFMRISIHEMKVIKRFLHEVFPYKLEIGGGNWGFFVKKIEKRNIDETISFEYYGSFKGLYVSNLVELSIRVLLEKEKDKINPKITIYSKKLGSIPKGELNRLVIYTRDALMQYIDYKKQFYDKNRKEKQENI